MSITKPRRILASAVQLFVVLKDGSEVTMNLLDGINLPEPVTQQEADARAIDRAAFREQSGVLRLDDSSRESMKEFQELLNRNPPDLFMDPEPRRRKAQWKQERYPMGKRGR